MSKFVKLSSVADLTVGFVGTMAKHYEETGIPFLRSLNIKPFKIVDDDMKYISVEFSNDISKSILHEGDVVIVRTGIPGTCCVVPAEYDGCNCSDVVIVHPKTDLLNPHYLAAYIKVWGQRQILNNKVGAIQQHFNVHSAEEMLIFLPDIKEQEKIAEVIVALNGKIENNNSVCVELEAMAKTLYDYWFTQFDFPNSEGRPYRTSGGEMVWNEQLKREIPKGWDAKSISSLCDILSGYSFSSTTYSDKGKYKLITIKNVQDTGVNLEVDNHIERLPENIPEFCKLSYGDILMSLTGNVGRVGIMYAENCLLNQRVALIQPNQSYLSGYLYILFRSAQMRTLMENITTGTSQKNLSPVDTGRILISYDEKIVNCFCDTANGIINKITFCQKENYELTKLRDWLLPMLINGQATVE